MQQTKLIKALAASATSVALCAMRTLRNFAFDHFDEEISVVQLKKEIFILVQYQSFINIKYFS